MDTKKFGWMIFWLGLMFGVFSGLQYSTRHLERWAEYEAIVKATKGDSRDYEQIKKRFEDADQLGMWLGITSAVACFLGVALVVSSRKAQVTAASSESFRATLTNESSQSTKTCPHCAEVIKAEAKICRFCQRELT